MTEIWTREFSNAAEAADPSRSDLVRRQSFHPIPEEMASSCLFRSASAVSYWRSFQPFATLRFVCRIFSAVSRWPINLQPR